MSSPAVVAEIIQIRHFPVKSLAADPVKSAFVGVGGLEHDRQWAIRGRSGKVLTAKSHPLVRQLCVTTVDVAGLSITLPGGRPIAPAELDRELSAFLGEPVTLARAAGPSFNEVAAVHLVSRQAMAAAAAGGAIDSCSVSEPRANLELTLRPGQGPESAWAGRTLVIDELELALSEQPRHCLGVYAEVQHPGRVEVGALVKLAD
jgi:uncharacterized protein